MSYMTDADEGYKRGEIFYIKRADSQREIGNEQHADRPAVIISTDKNNEHSDCVTVAYMTKQPKKDLPVHTVIHSATVPSTVLCEQLTTVSVERLGKYIGECTEEEMERIDICLSIQLGLNNQIVTDHFRKLNEELVVKTRELEEMLREQEQALDEAVSKEMYAQLQIELAKTQAELSIMQNMYDRLLEKALIK